MNDKKICSWCLHPISVNEKVCPHCGYNGTQKNPLGALPLGTVIAEKYRIAHYISIDGEGATYLAFSLLENKAVLIKEYLPVTLCLPRESGSAVQPKPGSEVLFKSALYDFTELYSAMSRYQAHPTFVKIGGIVKDNGTVYAIKEHVSSKTLVEYLDTAGYMDFQQAFSMLQPVFEAVEQLHADNILHRGISPENILIGKDGRVRLNGFATQALRTQGSELKSCLYKGYSAPEQYEITQYQGEFTDVYSLAAVLYTCVTGAVPPKATERLAPDSLVPAAQMGKGKISARQSEVLKKGMALKPEERIATLSEFEAKLRGEKKDRNPLARLQGLTSIQKQILIGVGGAAILVVLIGAGAALLRSHGQTEDSSSLSQVSESAQEKTPDFIGMVYLDVQANSEYKSKYVFVTEEVFSNQYKEGEIADQSPLPDTDYVSGTTIYLKISKGEEKAELPNVIGQTRENAAAALTAKGIQYEFVPVFDNSYPVGSVSGMDKQAGTQISIGRDKVILYVVQENPASTSAAASEEG